ncbi:MAG: hypothetical protein KJ646_02845 [Nanoarchaeota archaeon]|nr:hypothetical protein [Nanoarchaeota archaeon]
METGIQIYEEDDNLEQDIVFDRQVVTRYRYKGSAKPLIEEINYLKEEIQKLKLSKEQQLCLISDKEAKMQIESLIKKFKSQDIKNIDMIDIITELNLPIEQAEKIMVELEKEKRVKQNE